MKPIDIDQVKPDPVAAAIAASGKDTLTVSGYILRKEAGVIALSMDRDAAISVEIPRAAIIAAYSSDDSEAVNLVVDASARVRSIYTNTIGALPSQARVNTSNSCPNPCKSQDGLASCCCKEGERCRSLASTCVCEDAGRPVTQGDRGGAFVPPDGVRGFQIVPESQVGSAARLSGGGFGPGPLGDRETLPTCRNEWRAEVCGTIAPGYVIICWRYCYVCRYPNGSVGVMC